MDDQRVGAAFRAVRIKRGWTQADLASRCDVSASLISLIERGHLDRLSVRLLREVSSALEIRLELSARMRSGDLERITNAGHAAMHEDLARHLGGLPNWLHAPEVSFSIYGERGIIDILAFHPSTGALLVIELKTELVSFEDLLATMDVRLRLAAKIALERGWKATSVNAWVVVADTDPNVRRARAHAALLRSAFPDNGRRVRTWLQHPVGSIRALSFRHISNGSGVSGIAALRRRVRQPKPVLERRRDAA